MPSDAPTPPGLNESVGIVILAAGSSSRLGEPKQLLDYHGKNLLHHAVETALAIPSAPVVVVLGAFQDLIRPTLAGLPVTLAENADWPAGMGGSIHTGMRALVARQPETDAVIFLLCDQPFLSPNLLETLIQTHRTTECPIAASAYAGTLGVPALFHNSLFTELLSLEAGHGARRIITRHRDRAIGVPFAEGVIDIDTPGDYARLRSSQEKHPGPKDDPPCCDPVRTDH